jgi:O-antigen ligase
MGIGVKNFPRVVVKYDPRNPGMDAHNTYVLCYSEIGIIGICLLLALMRTCYKSLRNTIEISKNTPIEIKTELAVFTLTTILIIFFFGSCMTHSYLYLELTWILLALPICLEKAVEREVNEGALRDSAPS